MLDFNRRINRRTFLIGSFVAWALWVPVFMTADLFYGSGGEDNPSIVSLAILALYAVLLFIYTLCLTKQRSNDFASGNAVLMAVLLYVTGFAFIAVFIPGEKRANKYGHVPKGFQLK